jgi:peptidoglycan/xylan/chitin deacetylase (PgdA/CDA1 family)
VDLRRGAKGIVERALVWSGAAALARARLRGRALILAYHNVVPDGLPPAGDRPNHLPLSDFRAQLDALQETHDVVPLRDVLTGAPARGRPRVAITFDDAYLGAVRHAAAELAARGMPATIFVAPAFLDGRSFWWDALADPRGGGLDPRLRERALGELRGEDAAIRAWARGRGCAEVELPDVYRATSERELLLVASLPGITLGSHTWAHPNLTRLAPAELRAELERPLGWLRERVSGALPWIAYPYGSFDTAVAAAADDVGYEAGLAISGGWLDRRPASLLSLPRSNVPRGLSRSGFVLRGAGLLA